MKSATRNRRLGFIQKRYLGLYPRGVNIGDQFCVFVEGCVRFVIGKLGGRSEHQLVGDDMRRVSWMVRLSAWETSKEQRLV